MNKICNLRYSAFYISIMNYYLYLSLFYAKISNADYLYYYD